MTSPALPTVRTVGAYTCRGCGTQITTPNSFRKCPVCGIVYR